MAKKSGGNPLKYQPGEIYSFKTRPATRFSPPDTGRYGALKILGTVENGAAVCIIILDGVFTSPPGPADVSRLTVIRRPPRNSFESGIESLAVGVDEDAAEHLQEFRLVTTSDLTRDEQTIRDTNGSYSGWAYAAFTVESDWRGRNDAKAYAEERARQEEEDERAKVARMHRYKSRLKTLTIAQLRSEPLLPTWSGEHPPADFVAAVRARLLDTMTALEKLGEKPGKTAVKAVLKELMTWLNREDEERDHPIETIEREDLCSIIEELCWAAKQPSLVEPMLGLRDW